MKLEFKYEKIDEETEIKLSFCPIIKGLEIHFFESWQNTGRAGRYDEVKTSSSKYCRHDFNMSEKEWEEGLRDTFPQLFDQMKSIGSQ